MKHQKILVPVCMDQKEGAQTAVAAARSLCAKDGEIIILHAREPIPEAVSMYLPEDTISERNSETRGFLDGLASVDDRCEPLLITGRAGTAIVEYALNNGVDLIVIASHRPGLTDYFLGSTAARVVRHSPCAVFVLR